MPASGRRAASAAARSTTRPTTASRRVRQRRMPRPRTSISPASSGAGRTHSRPSRRVQNDTVVADQFRRRELAGAAGDDQLEGEARLAGAGGAADQHRAVADQHGGGVNAADAADRVVMAPAAGRRSARRARSARRSASRRAGRGSPPRSGRHGPRRSAGDRQAEAGILAEALMRPVGVEALEDLLERVGADARARRRRPRSRSRSCRRRQMTRTLPPWRENELRVVDADCEITWPSRESWPGHRERVASAGGPRTRDRRPRRRRRAASRWRPSDQRRQQPAQIDRRGVLALQFGIEPAGVGNVGDQPVEPLDVVLDHRQQPRRGCCRSWPAAASPPPSAARSAGSSARGRRRRRSSRSPRCGCRAHRSCRAARRTDGRSRRVRSVKSGISTRALDAAAHALGGVGEPPHRAGDGAGEQHRQHASSPRRDARTPSGSRSRSAVDHLRRCRRPASTAAARRARRGSAASAPRPRRSPRRGR